jgi:hypothetical protein
MTDKYWRIVSTKHLPVTADKKFERHFMLTNEGGDAAEILLMTYIGRIGT